MCVCTCAGLLRARVSVHSDVWVYLPVPSYVLCRCRFITLCVLYCLPVSLCRLYRYVCLCVVVCDTCVSVCGCVHVWYTCSSRVHVYVCRLFTVLCSYHFVCICVCVSGLSLRYLVIACWLVFACRLIFVHSSPNVSLRVRMHLLYYDRSWLSMFV